MLFEFKYFWGKFGNREDANVVKTTSVVPATMDKKKNDDNDDEDVYYIWILRVKERERKKYDILYSKDSC